MLNRIKKKNQIIMENTNALGFIRLSSYSQVKLNTKRYHKEIIIKLITQNNLKFIDWLELDGVSGRKEDNINRYFERLEYIIKTKKIKYLVSTELRNFGRLSFEVISHLKNLIKKYDIVIITQNLKIDNTSFLDFEKRLRIFMEFMMCEIEGYKIVKRTQDGKNKL